MKWLTCELLLKYRKTFQCNIFQAFGMTETAETLRGGWLHTGDMGRYDENRYVYIVDRKKDMIISGGENIYSTEIEYVILQVEGIAEVAVVAKPDEKWGEGCPTPLWFKPLTPILQKGT